MANSHRHQKRRARRFFGYFLMDILLTGVILCTFALFQHVIPVSRAKKQAAEQQSLVTPTPEPTPVPTEEPLPDLRTEWQKRFAEHFTDEVVLTENSYTSPNISLTITTHNEDLGKGNVRWYVCDIYIASIDNLKTALAHDSYTWYDDQDILEMMASHNAIFAMGGDSCLRQAECFSVKNTEVYDDSMSASELCLMYMDGSMEIIESSDFDAETLLAGEGDRQIYQSWHFGPSLLLEDGSKRENFDGVFDQYLFMGTVQPRAGIGYYEPGHYCMIVADGRQGASVGVRMDQLAELFEREGCALAYNLDGGRTAQIAFNGEKYSVQSNGNMNPQNDIIYLTDVTAVTKED